jgi:thiol-disulfide isomerase/thioredoxin
MNAGMHTKEKIYGVFLSALVAVSLGLAFGMAPAEIGKPAPEISGQTWINSKPLRLAELKGKVVLLEFWTFGCYNCRNVEPHVKAWHQKYADKGLVVIGVHAPEFSYERVIANVQRYVRDHAILYPIAIDNDFITWNRYKNRYWPALYLIDKRGIIRYTRVGEGGYARTDQAIQALLGEPSGS